METTNTNSTEKSTKLQRLQTRLSFAKAVLASREPGLIVALKNAEFQLEQLRLQREMARTKANEAQEAYKIARNEEGIALGLTTKAGAATSALLMQIEDFADKAGCAEADVSCLARTYIRMELDKNPRLVELNEAYERLLKESDRAYRTWNVAHSPDGQVWKLRRQLEDLRDAVSELEKEIAAVPRRNGAARERRQEAKAQALESEHTVQAAKLLHTFSFKRD